MLEQIYGELAKIIAKELFEFAKSSNPDVFRSLKKYPKLSKSGRGLPEPILQQFEESFLKSLERVRTEQDGYGYWRNNGAEIKFDYLMPEPLIESINESDWPKAAYLTAEGTDQVEIFGGAENYQKAISLTTPETFKYAIKSVVGKFIGSADWGFRVLTPVLEMRVAPKGTNNFEMRPIFFKSYGKEDKTAKDYKMAKKLIIGSWLKSGLPPSKGPYSTNT